MLYHLQYRFLVPLPFLLAQVAAALTDVSWDSPTTGDVYVPGDTLQAVWTSPDRVVSPSFTICIGTDDNSSTHANVDPDCGTAVWPPVERNGTEYSISLAIPNITGNGEYYLVMKDDTGTMYDTPSFSLALTNDAVSDAHNTSTSNTSQPATTSISYVPSHSASAVAAIAIPLSLVAAILLGALLLLLFRARRSRQRERGREKQLQEAREAGARSRQSTMSFASATDIERAVWALSRNRGYGSAAPFAPRSPSANTGCAFVEPGLGPAAAAAALGMGAFGWAHGFGNVAPMAPPITDAYTPAPMRRYTTNSAASSVSRSQSTHTSQVSQSERGYNEQETSRRPAKWIETDWRGTDRTFAEESSWYSQFSEPPPQPPAMQVRASSFPIRCDIPPPLPPKQLPGRLDNHAPRAYVPLCGPSVLAPESHLPLTPGTDTHASLSVISDYTQSSPAPLQVHRLNSHTSELSAPRVPPPSLIRARTLRRLETLQEREEIEKPLPAQPRYRVGADLYGAVLRAVGTSS